MINSKKFKKYYRTDINYSKDENIFKNDENLNSGFHLVNPNCSKHDLSCLSPQIRKNLYTIIPMEKNHKTRKIEQLISVKKLNNGIVNNVSDSALNSIISKNANVNNDLKMLNLLPDRLSLNSKLRSLKSLSTNEDKGYSLNRKFNSNYENKNENSPFSLFTPKVA